MNRQKQTSAPRILSQFSDCVEIIRLLGWKHAVLLYLREHMSAEYEEIIDWTEEMERVRAVLNLQRGDFPAPSTLCKTFKRASMTVWRQLLRRSAELLDQNGHAAIDATYFDRQQASSHYLRRIDLPSKRFRRRFSERQLREQSLSYAAAQMA